MPPRYAYWTIIVDDQPTAFRAGALEDLMPTFNRLKEKQPTAKLMWYQSGKLWPSRIDAREAMQVRGERGRDSDPRQQFRQGSDRPSGVSRFGGDKPSSVSRSRDARPEWKPKQSGVRAPSGVSRSRDARPEWKPKGAASPAAAEKRKWVPKAEYKKLTGTEAKKDSNWRPGGEHTDPRQKYKDAKKAKWSRFKQAIRTRGSKNRKP